MLLEAGLYVVLGDPALGEPRRQGRRRGRRIGQRLRQLLPAGESGLHEARSEILRHEGPMYLRGSVLRKGRIGVPQTGVRERAVSGRERTGRFEPRGLVEGRAIRRFAAPREIGCHLLVEVY